MADLFKPLKKKINHIIISFSVNGVLLMILGAFIVWTDFLLKLIVGTVTVVIAFSFLYAAYKLYVIKSDIEKYFKI